MIRLDTKIKYVLAAAVLFVLAAIGTLCGGAINAHAATSSSVFDDLRTDGTFNVEKYPTKNGDGSLKVIQLAESTDSELFVYVYQPSADKLTTATTISIAEQLNNADDLQPILYNLELISNVGVFFKYKVTGFKVSNEKERFYNVIMIQRPYVAVYDNATGNGNVINRKAYGVGQYWYATTTDNGDVEYKMLETQTVEIINPFTSHIRKRKANTSANKTDYYQDNYYVAFSTNRNIEKLLSATLEYRTRDYYYKENSVLGFGSTEFSEKAIFSNERLKTRDVYADETVNLEQQGFKLLFGVINLNEKFTWNRIQSSEDFVNNAGASNSDNNEIKKLQWVLMFEETSAFCYQDGSLITIYEESGQIIDNVTILRLEFVEDGVTYNLGTVSDTVSGKPPFGNVPPAPAPGSSAPGVPWWVWLLVALGAVAGVLILICIFVPGAAPAIGKGLLVVGKGILFGIYYLFYGLFWIISAPFRLIAKAVKNRNRAPTKSGKSKGGKRK